MTLNIIILAGGKGTRIKEVLKKTPKIMAIISGKPFLEWLLIWIDSWQINEEKNIFLSTCIGHEIINDYCINKKIPVRCIPEKKPLGTFGALANVAYQNFSENYLVLNGDTIFKVDFQEIYKKSFIKIKNKPHLILKESAFNTRYGGYKKTNKGWIFSSEASEFISLGSFLISYEDIKKRWEFSTSMPFNDHSINNNDREMMIDTDCFNKIPIAAEILPFETPFIDIGIPSSLIEAQSLIPEILQP